MCGLRGRGVALRCVAIGNDGSSRWARGRWAGRMRGRGGTFVVVAVLGEAR